MRRLAVVPLGALLMLCAAACTASNGAGASGTPTPAPSAQPAETPPAVTVPERSLGADVAMRLADGVIPPTNRWYSSLAFGTAGLPVFPKPLSFAATDSGFTMGLTRPTASANTIAAGASADISVSIAGASGFGTVTHADPDAVTLAMGDAQLSMAQGWPVVGVTADAPLTLTLTVAFQPADGLAVAEVNGTTYGVVVRGGSVDGTSVSLDKGGTAQFFAVPDGGSAPAFAAALGDPVAEVTWKAETSEESATTAVDYGTTTVLTMPAARAADSGLDCALGTYETIDGPFAVCAGERVAWSVPAVEPSAMLDLDGISDDQRDAISAALKADVAALPTNPSDSYFGAKALYRTANLLQVAKALGEDEAAAALLTALETALTEWGDVDRCDGGEARCFVYDPRIRGMVGVTPAFGSEDFNDHHFHYGYLLYAGAVAVDADPALADDIGPVFDQIAADIASGTAAERGGTFPAIRVFDPVAGHSWASGYSPFADGNNQESSSEAVAAWNAVALWGDARGNAALAERGRWMLAEESDAARRLWLSPDVSAFPAYEHSNVAMEWGAKRDYATWFSPEPAAMLGIQLIPMAPSAPEYLAAVGGEQIAASVATAAPGGAAPQFADYLLMYGALAGPEAAGDAWEDALALPDSAIDDGDSRTYLLAFLASLDS